MNRPDVIVTRHAGLVEWLARELGGEYRPGGDGLFPCLAVPAGDGGDRLIPVVSHVTPETVRGKRVVGVLPISLAWYAAAVREVEMPGLRPDQRGKELTPAEMDAAGARLGPWMMVRTESSVVTLGNGGWPTYAELEAERDRLRERVAELGSQLNNEQHAAQ